MASMRTLATVAEGDSRVIRGIDGCDDVRRRLAALGFVVGGMATVVSAQGGNLIVSVKESRVAVDRELASQIRV